MYLNKWTSRLSMAIDFTETYMTEEEYNAESNPLRINEEYWVSKKSKVAAFLEEIEDSDILLASYNIGGYEGDAFVLFRKDGKLYEVNGSHCSCYGLEGQWRPEETDIASLRYRSKEGTMGINTFRNELIQVLDKLEEET